MLSFVFFKQKTPYEMRISDLSSAVCSSDLRPLVADPVRGVGGGAGKHDLLAERVDRHKLAVIGAGGNPDLAQERDAAEVGFLLPAVERAQRDGKSVVSGKRGSVRVDRGCGHIITKKKKHTRLKINKN